MRDIEYELKTRPVEAQDEPQAAISAGELRALLDRCDKYRKRIRDLHHEWNKQRSEMLAEIEMHRSSFDRARRRLDPECKHTFFSHASVYETASLIEEIERRRGRIVAERLLYGNQLPETLAIETIGVLNSAIQSARDAEARWRNLLESRYRDESTTMANGGAE